MKTACTAAIVRYTYSCTSKAACFSQRSRGSTTDGYALRAAIELTDPPGATFALAPLRQERRRHRDSAGRDPLSRNRTRRQPSRDRECVALLVARDQSDIRHVVKRDAAAVVAVSALTLPHGLALVILAEQLYRAASLLQGHPYHRE